MIKQTHPLILTGLLGSDVMMTAVSWLIAYYIRFQTNFIPTTKGIPPFDYYWKLLSPILVMWIVVFHLSGLYRPRRGSSQAEEFVSIFQAISAGTILMIAFNFFYRQYPYSRLVLLYFWGVNIFSIGISRSLLRNLIDYARSKGYNLRHILIAGAGHLGQELTHRAHTYTELGLNVIGFVDDNPDKQGKVLQGTPVLGSLNDTQRIIQERGVEQLFIALPMTAHEKVLELLASVDQECVDVKFIPDLMQYMSLRVGVEELDGIPIVNLRETPIQGWNSVIKRGFDIAFSLLFIVLSAPMMLVLALLIKLSSPGPVLYTQKRMGLDGHLFKMYKFRSMRVNAESKTGAVWAAKRDTRRTRLGAFMRSTSLDELPQFFNVLRGDMSLVGPRPERPPFVQKFREKIPRYMLRHRVKSGITGWAQINGWRGNTSIEKRIEYDLYYIQNWSVSLDVKILFMTLWKGMINKHAY
ncbi:undecaprenyl-phosphate glucose phosphotransferase [candidate division KSB3 bacterium]|uniref:Undecaprenyl-phosphate glucose phosphotransferase n=1 Tax=candidate division KSB3 bacterium TaxID=2044937 RepID=A0A2G6E9T8_9BACT|nr:MAG: undecaprenyl-phosphate glucose phosphotransferase [candidate division KSB3 bacterium]PIE30914.1 MAG: undecaprenyl-phosphate glucose phosphotransferase [candidate division KSB3 bacterium]